MGKRYTLDNELERLTRLAGRLGRRLEYGLRSPRAAGEPEATILPGQEWREMFGAYERALRTIAHGSSEGVKLRILAKKASDAGVMTNEEYEREMRQLAAESVMEASDADLEAWLASRETARQGKAMPRGQA
jgi:PHD/YefM family antitoxin component YafN of YafNO toxin-antitoxin module